MTDAQPASYILGSGASLAQLTTAEREFLSKQPFVFAMNKYLMYWDIIGVHPSHYVQADTHWPAYAVVQRAAERLPELNRAPVFCLYGNYFRYFINQPWPLKLKNYRWLRRIRRQGRGYPVRFLTLPEVLYFDHVHWTDGPQQWADSLDEPLYIYRGSLALVLNLATLLNPGGDIYLLGVDMNTPESFYDDEIKNEPLFQDWTRDVAARENVHPTVATIDGKPGILHQWEFIQQACANRGSTIYNVNPHSLLVEEGWCATRPVPAAANPST